MSEANSGPRALNPFEFLGGGKASPDAQPSFADYVAKRDAPVAESDIDPSLLDDVPDDVDPVE